MGENSSLSARRSFLHSLDPKQTLPMPRSIDAPNTINDMDGAGNGECGKGVVPDGENNYRIALPIEAAHVDQAIEGLQK